MTKAQHGIRGALIGAAVLLTVATAPAASVAALSQDTAFKDTALHGTASPALEVATGIIAQAGTVDDCRQGSIPSALEIVVGQEFTWCIEIVNPTDQTATDVILVSPVLHDGPWKLSDLPPGQRFLFAAKGSGAADRSAQTNLTAKIGGRPVSSEDVGRVFTVAPAILTGQLTTDPDGSQPVADATVSLQGTDRSGVLIDRLETTTSNGTYIFEGLTPSSPGGYILTVVSLPESVSPSEDQNRGLRRRVEMLPGDLVRADITVRPPTDLVSSSESPDAAIDADPSAPEILAFDANSAPNEAVSAASVSPASLSPASLSTSSVSTRGVGAVLSVALLAVLFGLLRSVPGADRRQPRVPLVFRRNR